MTEAEMVGWHHQISGHEFEQTPVDNEGQESLACCTSWDWKESDTSWRLKNSTYTHRDVYTHTYIYM